jgi:serine/threonine-protein kinase
MNSLLASTVAALVAGLALGAGIAGYIALALPRLSVAVSWAATAVAACSLGVALGLLALGGASAAWLAVLASAACALVAGHAGWASGRADRQAEPASASEPRGTSATNPSAPHTSPSTPVSMPGPLTVAPGGQASDGSAGPTLTALGRYRIERQLGRGAMGAVYLGRDPQIGRSVAIKTMALASEFEGAELEEARKRFFREAATAGRLQHPDIVTIFDAGEDGDLAYIAMEFLKGHDLQRHAQPGNLLAMATVVRVGERVAAALAHAHTQGVVHRDVKPANVMVDLAERSVKVTDFGIARITDSSRTRTGMVLGTPSFMSPEQMSGRRVDGRADLYSLGVMLFQLLAGQLPHRADSMAKLMYAIANEPAADLRSLRPEVPNALALLVARLLSKQPEARHADGRVLAAELAAIATQWPDADWSPPSPTTGPGVPTPATDDQAYAATVRVTRSDPGHNSAL